LLAVAQATNDGYVHDRWVGQGDIHSREEQEVLLEFGQTWLMEGWSEVKMHNMLLDFFVFKTKMEGCSISINNGSILEDYRKGCATVCLESVLP
jgi:hypothetical protein